MKKRSISLAGHPTSVALEPEFWVVLESMAAPGPVVLLIAEIDAGRGLRPLASACRLKALAWALARGDKQWPEGPGKTASAYMKPKAC